MPSGDEWGGGVGGGTNIIGVSDRMMVGGAAAFRADAQVLLLPARTLTRNLDAMVRPPSQPYHHPHLSLTLALTKVWLSMRDNPGRTVTFITTEIMLTLKLKQGCRQ